MGSPPVGGLEDDPGAEATLGPDVGVDVDVGAMDGDGVHGQGEGVDDPPGEGLGLGLWVGGGVGAPHATQNTFCLAEPCSPVKFQKSL